MYFQELQVHDASGDQISLQAQVMTLREALDTIMEQKAKMESSFQADKKKYLVWQMTYATEIHACRNPHFII
jgi:hypothetical protein